VKEWLSSIQVDPLLLLLLGLAVIAYSFWRWSVSEPAKSRKKDALTSLGDIIGDALTDGRADEVMWARDVAEQTRSVGEQQNKKVQQRERMTRLQFLKARKQRKRLRKR
jgi:hypothetical protein